MNEGPAADIAIESPGWAAVPDAECRLTAAGWQRHAGGAGSVACRVRPERGIKGNRKVIGAKLSATASDTRDGCLNGFHGARIGNRRIGGDRHGDTHTLKFAERVEALARSADRLLYPFTPVVVVLRLIDGHDAGRGHSRDLLWSGQPAVFDAVPGVGI